MARLAKERKASKEKERKQKERTKAKTKGSMEAKKAEVQEKETKGRASGREALQGRANWPIKEAKERRVEPAMSVVRQVISPENAGSG